MALSHSPSIVTDGLVLCLDAANLKSYPGSGLTWGDLSSRGNNGVLVNGPSYSQSNNGIITFDGSNDYVNTTSIQFERTNPFSLSAWIRPSIVSNNQIINNENSIYRGYLFAIFSNSKLAFGLRHESAVTGTANFIQVEGPTMTANIWQYVCATYNGSSNASGVSLYLNGNKFSSPTILGNSLSATTISSETTWIGLRRPASTGQFNGNIAQVSIYNKALSDTEVLQNFNALRGRFGI